MVRQLIDLESFVTLSYARLDLKRRVLDLVDCGHTGMLLVRAKSGECEILHGRQSAAWSPEGEILNQLTVSFEAGGLFLFYSDGITEMRNPDGELFSADRLSECVRMNRELEPPSARGCHPHAAVAFAQSDRLSDDRPASQ